MYKKKAVPFTTRDKNRPQPSSKHPPKSGRWSRDSKQIEKTPKAATTVANSLKKPKGKVIKVKKPHSGNYCKYKLSVFSVDH